MKIAVTVVLVLLALSAVGYLSMCPCGPVPGAWLFGDVQEEPIEDWSFANDLEIAPLCQLQVTTWRPHSINLNCMSTGDELFVSCSKCEGKNWSQDAKTYPEGHIRIGPRVYPVTLSRVTDSLKLDTIWEARAAKVNAEQSPRPDHWWSFQLVSR